LLDECVPWPMHKLLADHECTTAQKHGWSAVVAEARGGLNEALAESMVRP
jgi:hypothetical protein